MLQEQERGFQCCFYLIVKDKRYPFSDFGNPVGISEAKLYTRSITCVFPSLLLDFIVDLGSAKQEIALLGTRGHKN
jgi:hypothetical protein